MNKLTNLKGYQQEKAKIMPWQNKNLRTSMCKAIPAVLQDCAWATQGLEKYTTSKTKQVVPW